VSELFLVLAKPFLNQWWEKHFFFFLINCFAMAWANEKSTKGSITFFGPSWQGSCGLDMLLLKIETAQIESLLMSIDWWLIDPYWNDGNPYWNLEYFHRTENYSLKNQFKAFSNENDLSNLPSQNHCLCCFHWCTIWWKVKW
jgi:hypothetical protein